MYGICRFCLWLSFGFLGIQILNTNLNASTATAGTASVTFTASGTSIIVQTSVGAPPAGYYDRVWVCTQTAAQIAQGFNGIYPIGVTAIPVQRFTDTGGNNTSGSVTLTTLGSGSRVYAFGGRFQNGTNAQTLNLSLSLVFADPSKTPQTITVTPTSGTVNKGTDFIFHVSGNQTSLSFSVPGIFTDVDGLHFPTEQIGIHTFGVFAAPEGDYAQSNTVTVTVTVRGYRVKIKLPANGGTNSIFYDISQNGVDITSLVQIPGAPVVTRVVEVPNSSAVTVTPRIVGVTKDGVIWTKDADGEFIVTPTVVTPVPVVNETDTVDEQTIPPPPAPSVPDVSDENKSVWSKTEESDTNAKDKTIKEGTDKIVSKLDEIKKAIQSQGGDYAPGNANDTAISEAAGDGAGATDGNGNGQGSASAKSSTQSAFSSAQSTPTFSPSGPSAATMSVVLPGIGTMNLDPASDPLVLSLCVFIHDLIGWVALLIYTWFAWSEFKTLCNLLTVSQQAVGNSVIAGTGAQATAIIAAVAITVLIVSFPSLYWAYVQMPETLSANPFSGATGIFAGVSLYLLYLMVPVSLILTLIAQAFTLRKFGLVTAMTIATAIRFIVP